MGISVWCEDEAGPYQTKPYKGPGWQPEGKPACHSHEYKPNGTAKLLTLFHPKSGELRVQGVTSTKNEVLHPWLKTQLSQILDRLPEQKVLLSPEEARKTWELWREGLQVKFTLRQQLPSLRILLVMDNLTGHKSPDLLCWMMDQGILPLYTPLGGSWLNMAESIQRILKRRALDGEHPRHPSEIIQWLEETAEGWNKNPTPFEWGGKRKARRQRAYERRHPVAGSGACTKRPILHQESR